MSGSLQTSTASLSLEDKVHLGSEFFLLKKRTGVRGEEKCLWHCALLLSRTPMRHSRKPGSYSEVLHTSIDTAYSLETCIALSVLGEDWCWFCWTVLWKAMIILYNGLVGVEKIALLLVFL